VRLVHRSLHEHVAGGGIHPLLMMGGIVGRLSAICGDSKRGDGVSLLVSLSVTPMNVRQILALGDKEKHGHIYRPAKSSSMAPSLSIAVL